jgi:hypothetical protein
MSGPGCRVWVKGKRKAVRLATRACISRLIDREEQSCGEADEMARRPYMRCRFLYRGETEGHSRRNEGRLKPKKSGPFEFNASWDTPFFCWDSSVTWDSTAANAVVRHQFEREGFPTSGLSTTPHFERAAIYARGRDGRSNGFVFKIDRTGLARCGVREFVVSEYARWPSVPQDDEVILVTPNGNPLPKKLVVQITLISPETQDIDHDRRF